MITLNGKQRLVISIICSLLFGAFIFISIYGAKILNFTYNGWILEQENDLTMHYNGWQFFRHAPWSFPLGTFDSLTYPVVTSIQNFDSFPLYAIFFKIFSPLLPETFQYFGLYGLLSFMLSGMFGMLLCRKFVKPTLLGDACAVLCGGLYCLSPIMINSLYWHSSVASHWIILMSLVPVFYHEELTLKQKTLIYSAAAFFGASLNIYMLVLAGIITAFSSLYYCLKTKNPKVFICIVSYVLTALIILYIVGAFNTNSKMWAENVLNDTFNINAFFNPQGGLHSAIFRGALPTFSHSQVIGYAYFGAGTFLLLGFAIYSLFTDKNLTEKIKNHKTEIIVCLALLFVSFSMAFSPIVTFGDKCILDIDVPDYILQYWSMLRCTARFAYIAYYLIPTLAFAYVLSRINSETAIFIIISILLLQYYDLSRVIHYSRSRYDKITLYNNLVIKDTKWDEICKNHEFKTIMTDMKAFDAVNIRMRYDLAQWAQAKHLKLSNYYVAREINGIDEIYRERLKNPDDSDLFLFIENVSSLVMDEKMLETSGLNYFYEMDGFILGSKSDLKELEKKRIPKEHVFRFL